ncbi:MAG: SRPBCC family protein [Actinomycetota bacterium]
MTADIQHAVEVQADPGALYRAITTTEGEAGFWTRDNETRPEEGSVARFGFPEAPVDVRMRIEKLEADRRVEWACEGDFPNWGGPSVTWTLEPKDGGTRVLFRHGGWPKKYSDEEWASVNFVWGQIVGRLKGYAESGKPQPFFP